MTRLDLQTTRNAFKLAKILLAVSTVIILLSFVTVIVGGFCWIFDYEYGFKIFLSGMFSGFMFLILSAILTLSEKKLKAELNLLETIEKYKSV